jgi:hypothetical protein
MLKRRSYTCSGFKRPEEAASAMLPPPVASSPLKNRSPSAWRSILTSRPARCWQRPGHGVYLTACAARAQGRLVRAAAIPSRIAWSSLRMRVPTTMMSRFEPSARRSPCESYARLKREGWYIPPVTLGTTISSSAIVAPAAAPCCAASSSSIGRRSLPTRTFALSWMKQRLRGVVIVLSAVTLVHSLCLTASVWSTTPDVSGVDCARLPVPSRRCRSGVALRARHRHLLPTLVSGWPSTPRDEVYRLLSSNSVRAARAYRCCRLCPYYK